MNRQIWIFGTLAILVAGVVWMAVFFTINTFWLVGVFSVALLYLVFHFRRGSDLWIERWKRRAKAWWEAQG